MTDDLSAQVDDALASWDLAIDDCLNHARRLLLHASDALLTDAEPDPDVIVTLASAWCDLAEAWRDRQLSEAELRAVESADEDDEDEEADVNSQGAAR